MDNTELYSEMRKLDSSVFELRLNVADRVWKIWLVMFVGFYFFTVIGLCVVHLECADAVREMQREMASATHLSASPRAGQMSDNRPITRPVDINSAGHGKTPQ